MKRSLLCLFFGLVLLTGCPRESSDEQPVKRPLEGLTLRLAVADDPGLAAAVVRLRGEWNAQTGAELQVRPVAEKDLLDAQALPADAVLCASHLLGPLAERKLLAAVPKAILSSPQWGDIFELLKLREAAWGRQIMAVPFGSPVLTCYYRADLLEKLHHKPPRSWTDYEALAKLLAAQKPAGGGPWCGTIEPLGPGWAALVLLARAAAYAKHRDHYSALFNVETMEPLVAGPPFVHALEKLAAATKLGPANPLGYDPVTARSAFWSGQCGMALAWPTAAKPEKAEGGKQKAELIPDKVDPQIRVGFSELPGASRVFNLSNRAWDVRGDDDDSRVPLLGIAGRLGVVAAKSEHREAAFQLLLWLSDSRTSPQVSAASAATTLFCRSQLKLPSLWVEKPATAAAVQYGDATEAALRHEQWLGALRLPGRAEYLAALDEAVAAAVRDGKPPQEALLLAEKKWREITARLGIERQRAAYRHSLGLE
jgi:ABC-type glycerol-3-phosphate transport system substrate-binding protein